MRRYKWWIFYKENHISEEYTFKDRISLNFCTTYGVGDHSLEHFPIILEKINNKKLVNNLSCAPKNEIPNFKKFKNITRLGTKIAHDMETQKFTKLTEKNDYPNVQKQKELFQNSTKIFQDIAA